MKAPLKTLMTDYPTELECVVADTWLEMGTIKIDSYGTENTYYKDEFDKEYYCKNYPSYESRLESMCNHQETTIELLNKEITELKHKLELRTERY